MKLPNELKRLLFKLLMFWSWLRARLAAVSKWLVFVGLGLIAYGIVYCWKGLPYPVATLMVYSGYGTLSLGAGLALGRRETNATLVLATISFSISLVLLVVTQPGSIFSVALLPLIGTVSGVVRLRLRRAIGRFKRSGR